LCVVAFSAGQLIVSAQATASISGKLVPDLINTPIPMAYVTATKSGLPPFAQTVRAAANASFQFSRLPSGIYTICVNATGFLNPCEWNLPTLVVNVGTGQSMAGNNLTIKLGTAAKLRIQDSSSLLSQKTKDGRTPYILAGVWTGVAANALLPTILPTLLPTAAVRPPSLPTQFHPVHPTGADRAGANFEVTVPRNTSLNFHITSGDLLLANSQGLPLVSNLEQQLFQYTLSDTNPKSFSYTIIGLVPGK
jgi:hypothetical protein